MPRKKQPELTFQRHLADYLIREHKYGVLEQTDIWVLLRHGLKVRGLEFRLFYPKPRSAAGAAAEKYAWRKYPTSCWRSTKPPGRRRLVCSLVGGCIP
jgi:hypothetical protein